MSYEEFDDPQDGQLADAPDIDTLAVLNKSEINQQIATARAYPRSIKRFKNEALQLATLDEQTAQECIYALPRDGKTIEGPSARFAEIVNYAWGNTRAGARVIGEDEEFVTSQGLFYDLEKNTAIAYEVKRRITNRTGKRFNADMVGTTSNAASSIALRNAVLKGIPKALWRPIYEAARKVVAGDIRTLANRRAEAIKQFAIFGVTADAICATLGVAGVEDISIDHLVTLKGILTAIQEGDTSPEQAFASRSVSNAERVSDATERTTDNLARKYVRPPENPQPAPSQEAAAETAPSLMEAAQQAQRQLEQRRKQEGIGQPSSPAEPLAVPVGLDKGDLFTE